MAGVSSFGTLLKLGDGGSPTETFTTVAEVGDIDGPGMALGTEDVTSHSSPGAKREYVSTIIEGGDLSFTMFFTADTTQGPSTGVMAAMEDREIHNFQLVFPTTGDDTLNFSGHVTEFSWGAPVEGALTADCTIQLTGDWSWS